MRKIKSAAAALLAMSVAFTLAATPAYAQIMDKVSSDAFVVVKVSNLAQTSAKIAKLSETLGINMFIPQLGDPLGALKQQLKITGGLQEDGELAFVYLDPKGGDADKSVIVLVPTSDYKALVGNLEGATTEGAITSAKTPEGEDMFIADWGGHAAVSPNKALVTAPPPSNKLKLPARAAKELAGNDLAVYANFPALREQLTADLAENREEAKSHLVDAMKEKGEGNEKYQPVVEAAVDQVFNVFEAFLRDSEGATLGLTLTENGVRENIVAEFKEGSQFAKVAAGFKNADQSLLTSIPTGKYLMYGGMINSPEVVNGLIDAAATPVLNALPADDEKLKLVPEYIASVKQLVSSIEAQSFGWITPQGAIGQDPIVQVVGSYRGNGDQLMQQFRQFNDKYAKVTNDLMAGMQGFEVQQSWSDAGKEIDGVKFGLVSTEIVGDSPTANQQRQAMQFMYGSPKIDMYVASAGDEVLSFMGVGDDAVRGLIAAAKNNDAPLAASEPVQAVTKELPKARIAETYFAVDEFIQFAIRAANQFGVIQGNIQMPPDLQPIGLTLSTQGNSFEATGYVTNDLLQALVTVGIQVPQMFQGGGGGRRGGGL